MAKFEKLVNGNIVFSGLTQNDILYHNFRGLEGDYNTAGSRNFNIIISDEELAQQLSEEGYNVKIRNSDGLEPVYHLKINLRYTKRNGTPVKFPPVVTIDNGRAQQELDEDTVGCLDKLLINEMDIEIRSWENPNKPGTLVCDLREMWASVSKSGLAARHERDYDGLEEDAPF